MSVTTVVVHPTSLVLEHGRMGSRLVRTSGRLSRGTTKSLHGREGVEVTTSVQSERSGPNNVEEVWGDGGSGTRYGVGSGTPAIIGRLWDTTSGWILSGTRG